MSFLSSLVEGSSGDIARLEGGNGRDFSLEVVVGSRLSIRSDDYILHIRSTEESILIGSGLFFVELLLKGVLIIRNSSLDSARFEGGNGLHLFLLRVHLLCFLIFYSALLACVKSGRGDSAAARGEGKGAGRTGRKSQEGSCRIESLHRILLYTYVLSKTWAICSVSTGDSFA